MIFPNTYALGNKHVLTNQNTQMNGIGQLRLPSSTGKPAATEYFPLQAILLVFSHPY